MKRPLDKRIYLLPNLLTTAGLFAAFYSIIAATQHKYETAAIAILVALIADMFDGRVARLTGTQSRFGAEYDSLADQVSFGVAPAILAYSWTLSSVGKIGWLTAFIYTAAVALRLARFNIQESTIDKRFFKGLACPAGAGVIASIIWVAQAQSISGTTIKILFIIMMLLISVLMVSNVRYYSFKDIDFKKSVPSIVALIVVLFFVGISLNPPLVIFIGFILYTFSGPSYTLFLYRRVRRTARTK